MKELLQTHFLSQSFLPPSILHYNGNKYCPSGGQINLRGIGTSAGNNSDFLSKCIFLIVKNIDNPELDVKMLSRKLFMSHSSLYKKMKGIIGVSINEFIRCVRLAYALKMLSNSSCTINEVAYRSGFNDVRYFREQFKRFFSLTPSAYRLNN